MSDQFFSAPILNSPYEAPNRHWELDKDGQPTQRIVESRRKADFITPIPKSKKRGKDQKEFVLDEGTPFPCTMGGSLMDAIDCWPMGGAKPADPYTTIKKEEKLEAAVQAQAEGVIAPVAAAQAVKVFGRKF